MNDEHARKVAEIEATMGDLVPDKIPKTSKDIVRDAMQAIGNPPLTSALMAQLHSVVAAHNIKQHESLMNQWGALAGQLEPYSGNSQALAAYGKSHIDPATMQAQRQIDAMTKVAIEQMQLAANPPIVWTNPQKIFYDNVPDNWKL